MTRIEHSIIIELELVLDEIVELVERLFSVMEALRENKKEVKTMQLYICILMMFLKN